jgi:molecular chaperone DnaJ
MPGSPKVPPEIEQMFGNLFADFFGKLAPAAPGPDVSVVTQITDAEAATGLKREISYRYRLPCEPCGGRGTADPTAVRTPCAACGGAGANSVTQGFFVVQQPCKVCNGEKGVLANPCTVCHGTAVLHVDGKLNVVIPREIATGTKLRIAEHGNLATDGTRGDLLVTVLVGEQRQPLEAILFPPQIPTAIAMPTPKQRAQRNAALLFTVFLALAVIAIGMTAF